MAGLVVCDVTFVPGPLNESRMNRWILARADWRAALERRTGWRGLWILAVLLIVIACALVWAPSWLVPLQDRLHALVAGGEDWHERWPAATVLAFCLLFAAMSASSLPGCSVLALGAGAVFGPALAALLITVSSALGALVPFYLARHVGRESLRRRFARQFEAIDQGVQHAGLRYLLLLRLAPVIPYALVNPLMGLTTMRGWTFFWVSALGMLAGSAVYALAGAGLGAWALPSVTGRGA
jgi:uncharacterized membrane protein YdjX (TVP38/TMEM64 family)